MAKASKQTITKDPVFALIEAHRNAIAADDALNSEWAAVVSTWTGSGWLPGQQTRAHGNVPDGLVNRSHAARAAEGRARRELTEAKPTTRAGKRARDEHLKANTREIQADGFRVWPPRETPMMTPTEAIPHLDQMPACWSVTDVMRTTTKSWVGSLSRPTLEPIYRRGFASPANIAQGI